MYGIYNTETIEKSVNALEKWPTKLQGIKNYSWVNLLILIGIYQKEWYIML